MHRSAAARTILAFSTLGLGGCELVFGLDDYAQATTEGTTSSTGTDAGPGTGAGSSTGSDASSGSTGTGGDGGAGGDSSASNGGGGQGGESCPCVPDGWTLVAAYPTSIDAPALECPSAVTADRVLGEATVACECSCSVTGNLDSRLGCWTEADCTGTLTVLNSALCDSMPTAKSCQRLLVNNEVPVTDVCIESSVVLGTGANNPFDLCTAPPDGVSCEDGGGVCDPPAPGSLWCIEGPSDESCPGEWPDEHTLSEGGTPTCDCACTDDVVAEGGWAVANPSKACFSQNTDITSRACQNVPDLTRFRGGPPLGDPTSGGCTPVQNQPAGRFDGATETRLCCRPQ